MLNIRTFTGIELPPFLAQGMAALTNNDSAHRRWFTDIANDGQCDELPADLVYAVCELDDDFDITPVGWASIYLWQGIPALEAFVAPEWRKKRVASACAAMLLNSVSLPVPEVGVFSDDVESIAKWCGCGKVVRYRKVDDGWVRSHAQ